MKQIPTPVAIGLVVCGLLVAGFFLFKATQPPDVTKALQAKAATVQADKEKAERQRWGRYRSATASNGNTPTP